MREAEEETGLKDIKLIEGFKEEIGYYYTKDGKKNYKKVVLFLGKVLEKKQGKISPEHEAILWLNFEKAIKKITHEKDSNILKKAEEFLNI